MGRRPLNTLVGCLLALVVAGIRHETTQAAVPELLVTESEKGELQEEGWNENGIGSIHVNQTMVLDAGMAVVELSSPSPSSDEVLSRMEPLLVREPTIRTPQEDKEAEVKRAVEEQQQQQPGAKAGAATESSGAGAANKGGNEEDDEDEDDEDDDDDDEDDDDEEDEVLEGLGASVAESSLEEMMRVIGEEEEERKKEAEEMAKDPLLAEEAERQAEHEKAAKLKAEMEEAEAADRRKREPRPQLGGGGTGAGRAFSGGVGGSKLGRGGLVGGAGGSGGGGRTRVPNSSGYGSSPEMAGMFQQQAAPGGGQPSFESILEMQEKSSKGSGRGRYEEDEDSPGLKKARMDARLVLETDALLQGGFGGPKIASPFDEEEQEDGKDGRKGRSGGAVVSGLAHYEVSRIIREGSREEVNHYYVLGVSNKASQHKIKERFRALVLQVHPDKCSHRDAHEAFQLVQEAYESLASPLERRKYDQFLVKMRAKRWRKRIRPVIDYLDEWSDWTDPIVENKRRLLAAIILWVIFL